MKTTLTIVCASLSMLSLQGCGSIPAAGNPVHAAMGEQQYTVQHAFLQSNQSAQPLCQAASRVNGEVAPSSEASAAENAPAVTQPQVQSAAAEASTAATNMAGQRENMSALVVNGLFMVLGKCVEFGHCGL